MLDAKKESHEYTQKKKNECLLISKDWRFCQEIKTP